jgi:hypothetical protein
MIDSTCPRCLPTTRTAFWRTTAGRHRHRSAGELCSGTSRRAADGRASSRLAREQPGSRTPTSRSEGGSAGCNASRVCAAVRTDILHFQGRALVASADGVTSAGTAAKNVSELSGVRQPSMIIRVTTTARHQRRHDHRLRDLVQRTGDVTIATNLGVPRSTARGWLRTARKVVVSLDVTNLESPNSSKKS